MTAATRDFHLVAAAAPLSVRTLGPAPRAHEVEVLCRTTLQEQQ